MAQYCDATPSNLAAATLPVIVSANADPPQHIGGSRVQGQALADAMWRLLDDMGRSGTSVCLASKGHARLALEPFLRPSDPTYHLMSMKDAQLAVDCADGGFSHSATEKASVLP